MISDVMKIRARYNYTGKYTKTKKELAHEKQKGRIGARLT